MSNWLQKIRGQTYGSPENKVSNGRNSRKQAETEQEF